MSASTFGLKNEPQFGDLDAPDPGVNPTQAAAYAALVGNRKIGTTAQRDALTGKDVWEGLLFGDITTGIDYRRTGGAWLPVGGDTGWINVTFTAISGGTTWQNAAAGEEAQYRRLNNVVYLRGRIALGSAGTAFTLPAGFRPGQLQRVMVRDGASTNFTGLNVNVGGAVVVGTGVQPNLSNIYPFPADN